MVDDRDPISNTFRLFHVMGRQEDGDLLVLIELFDLRPELVPRLRI
jgi:hypothetical protein